MTQSGIFFFNLKTPLYYYLLLWIIYSPRPVPLTRLDQNQDPSSKKTDYRLCPRCVTRLGTRLCVSHECFQHSFPIAKTSENVPPFPAKPDQSKTPPPARPPVPQVVVDGRPVSQKEEPTMASLQAEIKELRMALDLLQTRHAWVLF